MMNLSNAPLLFHKESRMAARWSLLVVLGVLTFLPVADAAKVKVWHQHSQSQYDKAKFKQAVVTSEGALRLSRQVKPLTGIEAANIWDLAEDKAGNLFVATGGEEGKLYKITPDGKSNLVHTSKDSNIFSLAVTPDGAVYAGTGPTGKVLARVPRRQGDYRSRRSRWLRLEPRLRSRLEKHLRRHGAERENLSPDAGGQNRGLLHHQARAHPLPRRRHQGDAVRRHRQRGPDLPHFADG